MHYFITCLQKYAAFSGRSRRAEYWYFGLFYILYNVVFVIIDKVVLDVALDQIGILSPIYGVDLLIASLAVSARRLHDIDKSAWWMLLIFVPLVGIIVLLIWYCKSGTTGPNRFGDDPKQEEGGTEEPVNSDPPHPHLDIPDSDPK